MPVGHSLLLLSFSACKSFLGIEVLDGPQRVSFFFRIAIWNRNIVVSVIAVCLWAGGLGLNIWSTSFAYPVVVRAVISFFFVSVLAKA
jgi:hypothetical protein